MEKTRKPTRRGRPKKGRANGHGTLEQQRNGTYLARWTANGKRFAKSTGTRNRREAEKLLEEYTAPFRLGSEERTLETVAARIEGRKAELRRWQEAQPALALADAFAAYRNSPTLRKDTGERTLDDYGRMFGQFVAWMNEHHPDKTEVRHVTGKEAVEYSDHFLKTHTAGTFNKHLTFVKHLWKAFRNEAYGARLTQDPWERIEKRRHEVHTRRPLTADELGRVCSAAQGEMRLLFALGIYTGLRLGDCATLEWGAVDLARGTITKRPHKTSRTSGRFVYLPIHPTLMSMLSEIAPSRRSGRVLPDTAEAYLRDPNAITNKVQRLFGNCGIETHDGENASGRARVAVGFHSLRHTFVSIQGNAGVSLAVVQSMVGHVSEEMTQRYFHAERKTLENAVCALPDVTRGNAGADAEKASEGRFCAFCAIVDGMGAEGLRKAAAYIARRIEAKGAPGASGMLESGR